MLTMNSPPVNSLGTSLVTSFKRFVWFLSAEVVTKWDVKGKFRGMLASQLRQEFPKLVQDPKAQPGFAVDDGLVAEGSDARPAYAASRQFKK